MNVDLPVHATSVGATGEKFAAFVARYADCAVVYIFPRVGRHDINFDDCRASYETASRGASASARKEIAKLEGAAA